MLFREFYYKTIEEATRRDFLKKIAGTAAASIAPTPVAAAIKTAAPTVAKALTYDLTDAVSINSLKNLFYNYGSVSDLIKFPSFKTSDGKRSEQLLDAYVQKLHNKLISSDKINARTAKILLASDPLLFDVTQKYIEGLGEKYVESLGLSKEDAKEVLFHMQEESGYWADAFNYSLENFFLGEDVEFDSLLMPGDIIINGKVVMTQEQAISKGVFKPFEDAKNQMFGMLKDTLDDYIDSNSIDRDSSNNLTTKDDDIEYSSFDYKGGYQYDPDTQPLSWESVVAEKSIHDPVRPGILKRQVKGKMTCSKARSLKSKQKNKGNNTAKAAQRYLNYHC